MIEHKVEIIIVLYCNNARLGLFELITVVDLYKIAAYASVDSHNGRIRWTKFDSEYPESISIRTNLKALVIFPVQIVSIFEIGFWGTKGCVSRDNS